MMHRSPQDLSRRTPAPAALALLATIALGSTVVGVSRLEGRWRPDRDGSAGGARRLDAFVADRVETSVGAETPPGGGDATRVAEDASGRDTDSGTVRTAAHGPPPTIPALARPAPRVENAAPAAWLPPALIDRARSTTWDESATASLERLLLLGFDADGDLALDDVERIAAVRSMRDAVWPTVGDDTRAFAHEAREAIEQGRGAVPSEASLSPEDLRLHHDVDESRRLDHAWRLERGDERAAADREPVDAERRAVVMQDFRIIDDGRLTPGEFARFLGRYRAGSEQADLNRDGLVAEADLRLFLEITSPIAGGAAPKRVRHR